MRLLRIAQIALVLTAVQLFAGMSRADAAVIKACSFATSGATHDICWLDFTKASAVVNNTIAVVLPDGSTLTGTLTNAQAISAIATPVYGTDNHGGVAFGSTNYIGLTGDTAFDGSNTATFTLTNVAITDPLGDVTNAVGVAAADAESTDTGDGDGGFIQWTTSATPLSQLQLMLAPTGNDTSICTLATAAMKVTCTENNNASPANAYIYTTPLTATSQTFTINYSTKDNAFQAVAIGFRMASLAATKTVASRIAGDVFTVNVSHPTSATDPAPSGAAIATASTTKTSTTATTGLANVVPGFNYSVNETTTAASSPISQYASTLTCVNATAGSATKLPSAVAEQAAIIKLVADDAVTCTFTNNAVRMTNVAKTPTATYPVGTSETDSFTLTNTSAVAGTFTVAAPTITPFTGTTAGTAIAPTGYTLTSGTATTTYATLAALNTALAGMSIAANGSVVVGVTYTTSAAGTTSDVVSLPATLASGTGTSATQTATETDSVPNSALSISKTGTTSISPGGLITYSVLVTNNGPSAATGAAFSDPMPGGITVTGTPTCATTTGTAVCGTVSVNAASQTVTSTVGTFPSGSSITFTITASTPTTCANASNPCQYTNTASVSDGAVAPTMTSALTTTVANGNGFTKTVADITQGGAAGSADTAKPGDVLQYVLTFTNTTGSPIYGLAVNDTVPANTTYYTGNAAATCTVAQTTGTVPTCTPAYTATSTLVSGTLPSKASGGNPLLPGASVTVTFQVKVN